MLSNIKPGSPIAVVAPAGPVDPETYQKGLAILSARYTIIQAYNPSHQNNYLLPYLSSEDKGRIDELNHAIQNPRVEAIFCARGGYGTMRILDQLDAATFKHRRPLLIGFSDITALHAWANCLGVPSIHGPVVTQLSSIPSSEIQSCFNLIEGLSLPRLNQLKVIASGKASGNLLGGNLTILSHLCGTPYQPNLREKILLLEEIGEAPYRIDRMLTQLRLGGVLQKAAGIIIGSFIKCDHPSNADSNNKNIVQEILAERLGDLGIPVLFGAPVGHGDHNIALPFGISAELDSNTKSLTFISDLTRI